MNSNPLDASKWTPTRPLAASVLLWFDLLALAIGLAQLTVGGSKSNNLAITVVALTWLVLSAVLVRVLPSLKPRVWLCCAIDTLGLLVFATGLAASTGGTESPLLTLMLLPLTAAAVALGRVMFAVFALATVGAAFGLGYITPDVTIASSPFVVWLISSLAPAIIATTAIAMLMEQMQGAEQQIEGLRSADPMTGLLNRRAFEEILGREHRKAERSARPYSLIAVNVANTGEANEIAGREGGNKLITAVAAAIGRSIRTSDIASRYDGDEFMVLLIDADAARASGIAQRIRSNVYAGTISVGNRLVRANIHLGTASFPKDRRDSLEVAVLAEQRMRHDRESHKAGVA
jgi:diguanylate cyclase (GGDEF)-like protein